ncbi:hypothetical protein JBL43_08010 [Aureibaculum sp. A20]|uniref:Uncharacterized protein n=1 Tax=Aureibaculum flavum TaxID=2795986 RepID=A0ABS0WQB8_9FLAO|nr:hypothetical protein [Aureibaculum flavum]MBJ2174178.1 hypothetical protein [Aureibaculum flavum]
MSVFFGEVELRQFLNNNLNVEFMSYTVGVKSPYGVILEPIVLDFNKSALKFADQLYNELKGLTKEQRLSIETTLKEGYLVLINKYIDWYKVNKELTVNYFPSKNPYEVIYGDLTSIKKEILKHIPELKEQAEQQNSNIKSQANYFDEKGEKLFEYLNENYDKNGKIKYINMFYYLRELFIKGKVQFSFTIDKYKAFILEKFNVSIKKFEKAEFLYPEKERPILMLLSKKFFDSLN